MNFAVFKGLGVKGSIQLLQIIIQIWACSVFRITFPQKTSEAIGVVFGSSTQPMRELSHSKIRFMFGNPSQNWYTSISGEITEEQA